MLLDGLGGVGDRRPAHPEHVRLARDFPRRDGVLAALGRRFPVVFFAAVAAVVAGGAEERLALRGSLLEEEAQGLLRAGLPGGLLLLACLAVAGGDDLVAVFVDHRRDLRHFPPRGFRVLVHVDVGAGRHRGDVLDVEQRLPVGARALGDASFESDHGQPPEHRARRRGAVVAGVEALNVRAGEWFLLEHPDVHPGAGVPGAVEAEGTVGVGDLVVRQAPIFERGRARRMARSRGSGGVGDGGGPRGRETVGEGCAAVDPQRMELPELVEADDRGDGPGEGTGEGGRGGGRPGDAPIGEPEAVKVRRERLPHPRGGPRESHEEAVRGGPVELQPVCGEERGDGVDRPGGWPEAARELPPGEVVGERRRAPPGDPADELVERGLIARAEEQRAGHPRAGGCRAEVPPATGEAGGDAHADEAFLAGRARGLDEDRRRRREEEHRGDRSQAPRAADAGRARASLRAAAGAAAPILPATSIHGDLPGRTALPFSGFARPGGITDPERGCQSTSAPAGRVLRPRGPRGGRG